MCGIAGVVGAVERGERSRAEVRAMTARLDRRGPDGSSAELYEGAALGHARLAIIDLVTGDQPQGNRDDSVVVVVNGEIYNYVELRRELEARGHVFRTSSDIEVIPHLYDEMGEDFVDRLRGMFAIALWDRRRRKLVLARDRLGKKPLYWSRRGGVLRFASELKALLAVDEHDHALDARALEDYFTLQYVPAPRTIFRDVQKLPAATMLVLEDEGLRERRYWRAPVRAPGEGEGESLEAALERLTAVFDEAVRIRLRSDVPLGAFLSSGIDSTLVVATAAPMVEGPLRATTIAFGDRNPDEVEIARAVGKRFGAEHHVHRIEADVARDFERVADYLDEPFADSSAVPTFLVSEAARRDVKVAISGDGGDESFGGYAWRYGQNLAIERVRSRLPAPLRRAVGLLAAVYPKLDRWPRPLRLKYGLGNLAADAAEAYALDMSVVRPAEKRRLYRPEFRALLGGHEGAGLIRERFGARADTDLLDRMLHVDLETYLGEGVLAKVDRMSMANSLEVRSPLLDQEVVELAFRLPPELKIGGGRGKLILRELARRRVGEDVARAPKSGFAPPLAAWLRVELREVLHDALVAGPRGLPMLFDMGEVRRLLDEHLAGRRDHARPLWTMLCFESWYRRFGCGARPA